MGYWPIFIFKIIKIIAMTFNSAIRDFLIQCEFEKKISKKTIKA